MDTAALTGTALQPMLESQGYAVWTSLERSRAVDVATKYRPDAIIVGIENAVLDFGTLDDLRTDAATNQLPVLVISKRKDVARKSRASYNVKRSITVPFDPEDLYSALREVLGTRSAQEELLPDTTHDGVVGLAEAVLERYSPRALSRWVEDLRQEPPWKERTDLDFEELLDVTPVVVETLVAALHHSNPDDFFEEYPAAREAVRKHGHIRASQQLPPVSLFREYSILRDEIWAMLWSKMPRTVATADVINLQRIINSSLDYMVELAVSTYLGERALPPLTSDENALDRLAKGIEDGEDYAESHPFAPPPRR